MKGFIEVINQIQDECKKHPRGCTNGGACPFIDDKNPFRDCYLGVNPEHWDPLEIIRRLHAND